MLARQFGDFEQDFLAVHRSCRIIGIDDDDGFGFGRNFSFHIGKVGEPAVFFVAQIMAYRTARKRCRRRPQRVVGRRNQDFVAVVQQRLHRHSNQLGHAVADIYIINRNIAQTFGLIVVNDGFAC